MKVGVVVFPGSNCDRDMYHVLSDVFHFDTQYFWHDKGLPKNIALQKAKLNMINTEKYSSPYYWAPYILSGAYN